MVLVEGDVVWVTQVSQALDWNRYGDSCRREKRRGHIMELSENAFSLVCMSLVLKWLYLPYCHLLFGTNAVQIGPLCCVKYSEGRLKD